MPIFAPRQYAFSAHSSNGSTYLNANDKVAFNDLTNDFGSTSGWDNREGGFDTTNHKYVAPVTGLYYFNVHMYFHNNNSGNVCAIVPRINNSQLHNGHDTIFFFAVTYIGGDYATGGGLYLELTSGDDVTVHKRNGNSGSNRYYGAHSHFQGHFIG